MRLKLKEDPKEWRKFAGALTGAIWLGTALLWYRGVVATRTVPWIAAVSLALVLVAMIFPRCVRPVYRTGMTVGFHIGQVVGKVILTLFFILVVTPLGLALRLMGKDLLRLRRDAKATTYWHPARPASDLDSQF